MARHRVWRAGNKDKAASHAASRRAARLHATPRWADKKAIVAIYVLSNSMTKTTGVLHHVHHDIPLRGYGYMDGKRRRLVCGLHIQSNLRVVTRAENLRIGANFVS